MELGLDVPEEIGLKVKWPLLAGEADSRAVAADAAVKAWEVRERLEATARSLKSLSSEFDRIGSGMPIRDRFIAGDGRAFAGAISQLGKSTTPESVRMVRQVPAHIIDPITATTTNPIANCRVVPTRMLSSFAESYSA